MKKTRQKRGKKSAERPVFDAIRKPLAPPGHAFSQAKPDERARPAMRKAKHKHRSESVDEET
ncbi:MAG TPA: hypothetical protein VJT09_11830 [Pyrinomonadaceae bacterium]|nr:hypothetical protein [Pyrinomonadaceae bacterium]